MEETGVSTAPETPAVTAEPESPSRTEAVRKIEEMKAELKRRAEQQFSGAASNASAGMMLDMDEAKRLHPGDRVRWVNVANAQKAQVRQASGYQRILAEEGGRQVGNLVLFKLPAEEHQRRVEKIKQLTQERLNAHNREAEVMAEGIAKELRDRHGIHVEPETIFGQRGGDPRR